MAGFYVDSLGQTWGDAAFTQPLALGAGWSGPPEASEVLADSNVTLTNTNKNVLYQTPTADRNVTLPTTSVLKDRAFLVINLSTGNSAITVKASDASTVVIVRPGQSVAVYAKQNTPAASGHWTKVGAQSKKSQILLHTTNGSGSTNNQIRLWLTTAENTAADEITMSLSATLGASFTILKAGLYSTSYDEIFGAQDVYGLSLNASPGEQATNLTSLPTTVRIAMAATVAADTGSNLSVTRWFAQGDVVRPHTNAGSESSVPAFGSFKICYLGS